MRITVEFDDQLLLGAIEVRDVRTDDELSPKLPSLEAPAAKVSPQKGFRASHCSPQLARDVHHVRIIVHGDCQRNVTGFPPHPALSPAKPGERG